MTNNKQKNAQATTKAIQQNKQTKYEINNKKAHRSKTQNYTKNK